VVEGGQYEYVKMPFGLKNSPAAFCRFINNAFRDLLEKEKLTIYIDDLLIATKTIEEHFEILREIFIVLVANKLTLKDQKM